MLYMNKVLNIRIPFYLPYWAIGSPRFSNDVGTCVDKEDMNTLGRRDDIEGSDTIQFRIVDMMVWLAEACLMIIKPMINSLFDLHVWN